ncbi:MAG: flagellar basal-body rod protein FlgF [Pseudomonadota bacterium]
MENASLINLSSQVALRRQLDVVANNLANLNTSGFKAEQMMFEEYLMPVAEMDMPRRRDRPMSFVHDLATVRSFEPGRMQPTDNPFDVAIEGDGWFVVQTPDGERYTRSGNFTMSTEGDLITPGGYPVMGANGPTRFGPDDSDILIGRDGTIASNQGEIGQLRVVRFETNMDLVPAGDTMFETDADPLPAANARVQQGMLERSNVQPIIELSHLIEVTRAYESSVSNQRRLDDLRRDAINTLGRMPN